MAEIARHVGVTTAFHSELPVAPCKPLPTVYTAVTRKTETAQDIGPGQKVTVKEAPRGRKER
jgi:predicted amidohydrolase YtcJ